MRPVAKDRPAIGVKSNRKTVNAIQGRLASATMIVIVAFRVDCRGPSLYVLCHIGWLAHADEIKADWLGSHSATYARRRSGPSFTSCPCRTTKSIIQHPSLLLFTAIKFEARPAVASPANQQPRRILGQSRRADGAPSASGLARCSCAQSGLVRHPQQKIRSKKFLAGRPHSSN